MRYIKVFLIIGCCAGIIIAGLIEINIRSEFKSMENYIPKDSIQKEIDQIKQMRLIQLLNWVEIKNKMLKNIP